MYRHYGRLIPFSVLVLLVMMVSACSSGDVSHADHDALQADLDAANTGSVELSGQVSALQVQIATTGPSIIVQTVPGNTSGGVTPTGWETEASLAANVQLLAVYDSMGPAAWDAAAHPDVFVTSEGNGYAGFYSTSYTVAGLQTIDAVTKEHVASVGFDLGYENMGTPHRQGVSPDGRWIYVPTADGKQPWQMNASDGGRLLVVDAKTLKLAMVIGTNKGPHQIKSFTDMAGNDRIIVETQGAATLLLDPNDDHRVVFDPEATTVPEFAWATPDELEVQVPLGGNLPSGVGGALRMVSSSWWCSLAGTSPRSW